MCIGGTGSVGPWFFKSVRDFSARWRPRCRTTARRGDSSDGRSPSLRDFASEGPALSVRDFCVGPWFLRQDGVRVVGRMRAVGILRTGGAHPSEDFASEGPAPSVRDFGSVRGFFGKMAPASQDDRPPWPFFGRAEPIPPFFWDRRSRSLRVILRRIR